MDDQSKNLILATALSFLVILVWFFLFPPAEQAPNQPPAETAQPDGSLAPPAPDATTAPQLDASAARPVEAALAASPRLPIRTPRLEGSLSLTGARIDYLELSDYKVTLAANSPVVTLLKPSGAQHAYYALYGWAPAGGLDPSLVPGPGTVWSVESGEALTETTPVTLRWDNGAGLIFRQTIAVDPNYMFAVTQSVENTTGAEIRLAPYGIIARHGTPPDLKNFYILHEGAILVADGQLTELKYKALRDLEPNPAEGGAAAEVTQVAENGWIGFTDHYWMSTLVAPPGQAFTAVAKYTAATDTFQTDMRLPADGRRPGRQRLGRDLAVRRRQGMGAAQGLPEPEAHRPLRRRHRLGLVLLPDQADLHRAARGAQADRQHGPGDHRAHLRHQADPVPARLQVLRLDVEDEGTAARDGEDQGAGRRRPHEDAAGDDGALQAGEGEPRRRLPADPAADPDLLLALQGDLRHHRAAPRAVLRLDPRPLGARTRRAG